MRYVHTLEHEKQVTLAGADLSDDVGEASPPTARLALFGRQLLEGLRFLRACGVPAAHVHAGNLLLRRVSVPPGSPADSGWAVRASTRRPLCATPRMGAPPIRDSTHDWPRDGTSCASSAS